MFKQTNLSNFIHNVHMLTSNWFKNSDIDKSSSAFFL